MTSPQSSLLMCLSQLDVCNACDASEALETLLIYMDNILKSPNDPKYRCIRLSNVNYQERLGHLRIPFLEALGFEPHGDFLKLDLAFYSDNKNPKQLVIIATHEELKKMKIMVEEKLKQVRATWINYSKTPQTGHVWASVAHFSSADDIGKRNNMEVR